MKKDSVSVDVEVEMPSAQGTSEPARALYRLLFVADLAGGAEGSVEGPLTDGRVEVDAACFDECFKAARPSVNLAIADPLSANKALVSLPLRFDSIRSFDPHALIEQIPAARALMAQRGHLKDRLLGRISEKQLAQAVAGAVDTDPSLQWLIEAIKPRPDSEASSAAAPVTPAVVDDLLGQLDLEDNGDVAASSRLVSKSNLGKLVSAAASGATNITSSEAAALRPAIAEIDRRIGLWLTAVLHSSSVKAVESAWRGLAYLVKQIDFRKGVRLSVLHATRETLAQRFNERVIGPVFDEGADSPDLIVVNHAFANTAPDIETLDELAQHAASLPAVLLASVSPAFFGSKFAWQVPTLPNLRSIFDQWQFAKWNTLRTKPYARSLAVVFGRCLLRPPHGRDGTPELEFAFREDCIGEKDGLWCEGVIAAAANTSRSFADTGWPTAMAGHTFGRTEGFAIAHYGKNDEQTLGPADTLIPSAKLDELAAGGINAVITVRDSDEVMFCNGLTAARPGKLEPGPLMEVSLPYQLFASRLASTLFALKPSLSGLAPEKLTAVISRHLGDLLRLETEPTPEQVNIQTQRDDAGNLQLAVTVTPPANVVPGGIPVVLGLCLE